MADIYIAFVIMGLLSLGTFGLGVYIAQRSSRRTGNIVILVTVVLFGFKADGKIEIGDPAVGREYWDIAALKDLWHGEVIRLVKR